MEKKKTKIASPKELLDAAKKIRPEKSENGEKVTLQTQFYRDNYPRFILFCFLVLLISAGSILLNIVQLLYRAEPLYFATEKTSDGQMTFVKMIPLTEPNLSTETLLQWATQAATACYTYDFNRMQDQIPKLKRYFTSQGFQQYTDALEKSGQLKIVKEKQLVVSSVPIGAPVILREALSPILNRHAWQIQLPLLVSYQSASDIIKQELTVTLLIIRVDTLESSKGIGIAQFLVSEGKG